MSDVPNVSDGWIAVFPAKVAGIRIQCHDRMTVGRGHKDLAPGHNDPDAGISGRVSVQAVRPDELQRRLDRVIRRQSGEAGVSFELRPFVKALLFGRSPSGQAPGTYESPGDKLHRW